VQPGHVVEERYRVDERVDSGGMGTVFRGTDLQSGATVAIKVLALEGEADAGRFEREARVLAGMSHPAIVRFLAAGALAESERYLVMEWVGGETLAQRLSASGLDIHESMAMAARLAEALGAMHAHNVVHRDLKPKNVILEQGQPQSAKLIDFGIARNPYEVNSVTRTGVLVGTPGYMAPEQIRGTREFDGRLDLFSLGCLLYESLGGRHPFTGGNPLAVRTKILFVEPPPVSALNPDVSRELSALVARLLEKDIGRRPANAAEVGAELSRLREKPGTRRPVGRSPVDSSETRSIAIKPLDGDSPVCVVLVGVADDELEPDALRALREDRLARMNVALPANGKLEVLDDGWSVVTLSGRGSVYDATANAARLALKLRADFPADPMAIAALKDPSAPVAEMIDRGADTATREAMESIFGDVANHPGRGAIRIDETTVHLLPEQFEVVRSPGGYYLLRERGVPI
jgi:serine/threonine protein kinase